MDEVTFSCKLSHKGKKAKWYMRNNVSIFSFHQCTIAFRNQKTLLTSIVYVSHRSNCYVFNVSNDFTKHVFQDYLEHLQFPPPIPKHYPGPFDNAGRRAILLQFKYCNFFSLLSRVLFILFQLSMQRNRRYIGKAIIPLLTFDDIDSIEFYPYIIYQGNPKISHCS